MERICVKAKVAVVGDSNVGKLDIIKYDCKGSTTFKEHLNGKNTAGEKILYFITETGKIIKPSKLPRDIGVNTAEKNFERGNYHMNCVFLDISGKEEFRPYLPKRLQGSKAAVIVSDVTKKETMENMYKWAETVYEILGKVPLIFIGNKIDMINDLEERNEIRERIERIAKQYKAGYFLTSAKEGKNMETPFECLADYMKGICIDKKEILVYKPFKIKKEIKNISIISLPESENEQQGYLQN